MRFHHLFTVAGIRVEVRVGLEPVRDARNAVYVADGGRAVIIEPTAPRWLVQKLIARRIAEARLMLAAT